MFCGAPLKKTRPFRKAFLEALLNLERQVSFDP